MGMVSECCCKEVYIIDILIIINTFPTPLVLTLFFGSIIPISLFIFKCFFVLVIRRRRVRRTPNGDFLLRAACTETALAMLYTHSIGNQP